MKIAGTVIVLILGVVGLSGFFPVASPRPAACESTPAPSPASRADVAPAGLLARVHSPDYRRTADLTLKVNDCVKAEDELEGKLEKIRGEILDLVMDGTEGSRRCVLRVLVPSPSFRTFVGELRGMGKVQAEKITAAKIKSGSAAVAAEEVDPRELCLVAIRMADEKVAASVLEGRGTLAASFDRSASHLMTGAAVLVEGAGYVLPFALAGAALLIPAWLLRRFRKTP